MALPSPIRLIIIVAATHTTPQVWQRGFNVLRTLTLLEPVHHFIELGRKFLPHFLPHFAHHLPHGTRVIFESFEAAEVIRHAVHAAFFSFGNAHLRHASAYIFALAVRAGDSLFSMLAEGEENLKALAAIIADKIISWHIPILTESCASVGELRELFQTFSNGNKLVQREGRNRFTTNKFN